MHNISTSTIKKGNDTIITNITNEQFSSISKDAQELTVLCNKDEFAQIYDESFQKRKMLSNFKKFNQYYLIMALTPIVVVVVAMVVVQLIRNFILLLDQHGYHLNLVMKKLNIKKNLKIYYIMLFIKNLNYNKKN